MAMTSKDSQNQISQINNQYLYLPYGQQANFYQPTEITQQATEADSYQDLINQTRKPLNLKKNQFSYTGQQTDPSTNLMMLGGFRNYAPGIGRFIQPDTYNSFSKTAVNNPYAYVKANPMAYTDPTGHMPEWLGLTLGSIGLVGSIAAGAASGGTSIAGGIALFGAVTGAASAATGIAATVTEHQDNHELSNQLNIASMVLGGASILADGASAFASYKGLGKMYGWNNYASENGIVRLAKE